MFPPRLEVGPHDTAFGSARPAFLGGQIRNQRFLVRELQSPANRSREHLSEHLNHLVSNNCGVWNRTRLSRNSRFLVQAGICCLSLVWPRCELCLWVLGFCLLVEWRRGRCRRWRYSDTWRTGRLQDAKAHIAFVIPWLFLRLKLHPYPWNVMLVRFDVLAANCNV